MTTLDYAEIFETRIRPRQRLRRRLFNAAILIAAATPLLYLGVTGLG